MEPKGESWGLSLRAAMRDVATGEQEPAAQQLAISLSYSALQMEVTVVNGQFWSSEDTGAQPSTR